MFYTILGISSILTHFILWTAVWWAILLLSSHWSRGKGSMETDELICLRSHRSQTHTGQPGPWAHGLNLSFTLQLSSLPVKEKIRLEMFLERTSKRPSEKIQRALPAASGAPGRLEVMLGWLKQEELLKMFQVKNNPKSDELPKQRESSFVGNPNTILRGCSKNRSYSMLALGVANCSFSDFSFFLRQGRMCPSPELLLEEKLEGGSNSQIVFWNG